MKKLLHLFFTAKHGAAFRALNLLSEKKIINSLNIGRISIVKESIDISNL